MKKAYEQNGQLTLESMSRASWYNTWTIKFFKKYLHGDILEVGCGIGNFTKILASYGNVYSFDPDPYCVRLTKQNAGEKAKAGLGDIEKGKYFFKKKIFDVIVCINVLEHIKDDKKSIKNMIKLLKPDGTLIILVPSHQSLYGKIDKSIGHYRRYDKKKLVKMLKKLNLEIKFARRLNFLGAIGWFVSGKLLKDVSVNENKLKIFNYIAPVVLPLEEIIEPFLGTSILLIAKRDEKRAKRNT